MLSLLQYGEVHDALSRDVSRWAGLGACAVRGGI
jgi:hypothetical protein